MNPVEPGGGERMGAGGGAQTHPGQKTGLRTPDRHESLEDLVIAPGGYRPRSHVHLVNSERTMVRSQRPKALAKRRPAPGPPDVANWIGYAGWTNATGQPITSFLTCWTVPQPPVTVGSQLIYLFNGIEPADGSLIVQPVLQWGDSGVDEDGQNRTGPFWSVASWVVPTSEGDAYHTPHVQVQPGDQLIGAITLVSSSAEGNVYNCEFQGLAGTNLSTTPIAELTWCVQALEAYELNGDAQPPYDLGAVAEYPNAPMVAFQRINVVTAVADPPGPWTPQPIVTTLGEHVDIPANSTTDGEVVIYFS